MKYGTRMGLALGCTLVLLAGCDEDGHEHEHDHDAHSHEVPAEYATLTNPTVDDGGAAAAGKVVFDAQCASCHGATGKGDGATGAGMNPAPTDLTDVEFQQTAMPGYLFWRITEGGADMGTGMPAFGNLTEQQRWEVVSHVRALAGFHVSRVHPTSGGLEVRWAPDTAITTGDPWDLTITVTPPADGSLPSDLEVAFEAWMPVHGHGAAAVPTVTGQGDGVWKVEGLGFPSGMTGHWELRVDVTTGGETERLVFDLFVVEE